MNETPEQLAQRAVEARAAWKAERIAAGLCAIEAGQCLTHGVEADFDHYLATRPAEHKGHDPVSGIAYND